jgi:hypothetical protein
VVRISRVHAHGLGRDAGGPGEVVVRGLDLARAVMGHLFGVEDCVGFSWLASELGEMFQAVFLGEPEDGVLRPVACFLRAGDAFELDANVHVSTTKKFLMAASKAFQ